MCVYRAVAHLMDLIELSIISTIILYDITSTILTKFHPSFNRNIYFYSNSVGFSKTFRNFPVILN